MIDGRWFDVLMSEGAAFGTKISLLRRGRVPAVGRLPAGAHKSVPAADAVVRAMSTARILAFAMHPKTLELWLDPGATFESQDDVSAWAWHPAAEDAVSYSHLDVASWPGPICDVCYASTCAFCGYVFADVGEASPLRTTRRRLACVACAEWGASAPMLGPDWEALAAAPPVPPPLRAGRARRKRLWPWLG